MTFVPPTWIFSPSDNISQPTRKHHEVKNFVTPEEFKSYESRSRMPKAF